MLNFIYVGNVDELGSLTGKGIRTDEDGWRLEGEFDQGAIWTGKVYDAKNRLIYEGSFLETATIPRTAMRYDMGTWYWDNGSLKVSGVFNGGCGLTTKCEVAALTRVGDVSVWRDGAFQVGSIGGRVYTKEEEWIAASKVALDRTLKAFDQMVEKSAESNKQHEARMAAEEAEHRRKSRQDALGVLSNAAGILAAAGTRNRVPAPATPARSNGEKDIGYAQGYQGDWFDKEARIGECALPAVDCANRPSRPGTTPLPRSSLTRDEPVASTQTASATTESSSRQKIDVGTVHVLCVTLRNLPSRDPTGPFQWYEFKNGCNEPVTVHERPKGTVRVTGAHNLSAGGTSMAWYLRAKSEGIEYIACRAQVLGKDVHLDRDTNTCFQWNK
jgi:hypothetical protein